MSPATGPLGLPEGEMAVVDGENADGYVVLDRVADVARADTPYCIHGQVTCSACGLWCWLGHQSHDAVKAGTLRPICLPCARTAAEDAGGFVRRRAGRIIDHRREDGPHD